MVRGWQETEFADYREHRVRRRARDVVERQAEVEARTDVRRAHVVAIVLALATLVPAGGTVAWIKLTEAGPGGFAPLRVAEMRGAVEVLTDVKDWPARQGEAIQPGCRLRSADGGGVRLDAPARDTGFLMLGEATLSFLRLQQSAQTEEFQIDVEVLRGDVVVDFRNPDGWGIVRVRLPQGVNLVGKGVLLRVSVTDRDARVIVADGLVQASGGNRKVLLRPDQEMSCTFEAPLGAPVPTNVLRHAWRL